MLRSRFSQLLSQLSPR